MKILYGLAIAMTMVAAASLPALGILPEAETEGVPLFNRIGTDVPPTSHAQQRISGTVADINQEKGLVALTSPDGLLKVHFPPQSIRGVRIGDSITVQFAIAKADASGGSTRAYDAPAGFGQHRMAGTVLMVDHEKGDLQVKTDASVLVLHFPPGDLQDVNVGERIVVDLSYSKHDVTSNWAQ
jgi:hypothetical protein